MRSQSASWFDLCIASQFTPGGLRVQFCKQLCKWEVILLTDLDIQQCSWSTEQHPPSWQNYMEMVAISKRHLTSEAVLDFSALQWIQMDSRERIKGLAEDPAAASQLGSSRSIHFNFFFHRKREEKTSLFHTYSSINLLQDNLKRISFLLKEETHSQPTLLHWLSLIPQTQCLYCLCMCAPSQRDSFRQLLHFSALYGAIWIVALWSNFGIWKMESVIRNNCC